jgi:hypothetical protein
MSRLIDSLLDDSLTDLASYPWYLRILYRLDFDIFRCRWTWFCLWVDRLMLAHRQKR